MVVVKFTEMRVARLLIAVSVTLFGGKSKTWYGRLLVTRNLRNNQKHAVSQVVFGR